jgi:ribonuclease P protein component
VFSFNERVHSEQFEQVLKRGKMIHSPLFSLCYLEKGASEIDLKDRAFAVVASKKVSKKAVIRNKNKRRVRHALKNMTKKLKSGIFIVFIKKDLSSVGYQDLSQELGTLLGRVAVL